MKMTVAAALAYLGSVMKARSLCSGPCHSCNEPPAEDPLEVLRQEVLFLRGYCGAPFDLRVPLDQYNTRPWPPPDKVGGEVAVEVNFDAQAWADEWAAKNGAAIREAVQKAINGVSSRVAAGPVQVMRDMTPAEWDAVADAKVAEVQQRAFENGVQPRVSRPKLTPEQRGKLLAAVRSERANPSAPLVFLPGEFEVRDVVREPAREMDFARPDVKATDRLTLAQAEHLRDTTWTIASGMDWDGRFKPLDQLSYTQASKPGGGLRRWTGAAGTDDVTDPRNWEAEPHTFPQVVYTPPAGALGEPVPVSPVFGMERVGYEPPALSPEFLAAADVEAATPVIAMSDVSMTLSGRAFDAARLEVAVGTALDRHRFNPDRLPSGVEEAFRAKLAAYTAEHPACEGGCGTPTAVLVVEGTRRETVGKQLSMGPNGLFVRRYRCPKCDRPAVAAVDLCDLTGD